VPSGTPSTEPSGTAAKITEVARAAAAVPTSRGARPAPIDQKPPMTTPTRNRAASSTQNAGATAARKPATASRTIRPPSTHRRSIRPAATVTTGAATAATNPGTVMVQPAVPAETPNPVAIGVSSPIGRISVVTMAKIPTVTAKTAGHRDDGAFMGPSEPAAGRAVRPVCDSLIATRGQGGFPPV
jgi:hypothetical protein